MLIPQVLFTIDPGLLSHYKGGFRIPRRRGSQPSRGRQSTILTNFPKTAWNWENFGSCVLGPPPPIQIRHCIDWWLYWAATYLIGPHFLSLKDIVSDVLLHCDLAVAPFPPVVSSLSTQSAPAALPRSEHVHCTQASAPTCRAAVLYVPSGHSMHVTPSA